MLRYSKHVRKGLCPLSLREPQTDDALLGFFQTRNDASFINN